MSMKPQIVPFSSTVGQSVLLMDGETERAVAQLAIILDRDAVGDQSYRKCSEHVARKIVKAFEVLRANETNSPERKLVTEILAELQNARAKFPGDNVTTLALVEEVGELAKATFSESRAAVRKEAVQVAVMAMRVVLDGDYTLDEWRNARGLDPLVERA